MDPDASAPEVPEGFAMPEPATGGRGGSLGFLLDSFRRRRSGRVVLNGLVAVLFVAGAGMFAYPFFTDVYTEHVIQRGLEQEFETIQVESFEQWEAQVVGDTGTPLTKIAIDRIGIETLVVEGTSPAALRAGAGHYPNTPLPGQSGNVAIAGHRTTYGKPFNQLDRIQVGDDVWLVTPVGDYRYVAVDPPSGYSRPDPKHPELAAFITTPKDWAIIEPTSVPSLTLTSCHPKGSARQRIVLRAELAEEKPAGWYDANVANVDAA